MIFFRAIASFFYGIGLRFRHFLYDTKMIKRRRYDIPVVCVGNITAGGTGKTPMIEFLIPRLEERYTVAVLSRGYGRKTKGYREVTPEASFREVGDEPKQIKGKFPDTTVVVCEDRREGIRRIMAEHPEVTMILMDDGFQHKRVEPSVNIVLVDYTRPVWEDHLLPWGNLRDLRSQMPRAGIVVFTKVPKTMSPIDRRLAVKNLNLYPYQKLYFTGAEQGRPRPLFPDAPGLKPLMKDIAVLAGVGNPDALLDALRENYSIHEKFIFADHHAYKVGQLKEVASKMAAFPSGTVIVTTEKDAVKLTNRDKIPEELQRRLYVVPMRIDFIEGDEKEFIQNIIKDVRQS